MSFMGRNKQKRKQRIFGRSEGRGRERENRKVWRESNRDGSESGC